MENNITSINTFKQHFTSVRPTLFKVILTLPTDNKFLENDWLNTDNSKYIYIYCKNAILPSSRIDERIVYYFGRAYYEAGDRTFDSLQLTFYNSQDFAIRNFIEKWMNNINRRNENSQDIKESYDYFLPQLDVCQLNRRNETIKTYSFLNVFPIECSEIDLNFSATNEIEEFTVTFRYQYWEEKTDENV